MMQVISISNQKGGVGKTTTTINLATAFAAIGKEVLIIDFDPQGNASSGLGMLEEDKYNIYQAIINENAWNNCVQQTAIPNLSIITATNDLAALEQELATVPNKQFKLRKILEKNAKAFDYILIDCPPALGLLTINALVASHSVIIPVQCEYYALEGLKHLIRTVSKITKYLNPYLEIIGIVLTMYDSRSSLCNFVVAEVRKILGNKVLNTIIPRNVKIAESPSCKQPVLIYDVRSTGAMAYMALAIEIIRKQGDNNVAA